MVRRLLILCSALTGAISLPALACDNPPLPVLPSETAGVTGRELAIERAVKNYFVAVEKYVACIQAELQANGGDEAATPIKTALVLRNNAAVAEAQAIQAWFDAQFEDLRRIQ